MRLSSNLGGPRASNMVLSAHSDSAYLNVSKTRSHAGAHIMMSKDVPVSKYNGPILTIAKIIKCAMSSSAEAELAGIYICAKEMVPLRQSLIEMGWPHPISPIQCDNSTVIGVTNETIIPRKTKSMDMQFHWLRCRDAQGQFRYFWAPGPDNIGDYSTKKHPPIYHLSQRNIRQIALYCPRLIVFKFSFFFLLTMFTARVCRYTGIPPVATAPVNIICSRSVLHTGQD